MSDKPGDLANRILDAEIADDSGGQRRYERRLAAMRALGEPSIAHEAKLAALALLVLVATSAIVFAAVMLIHHQEHIQ